MQGDSDLRFTTSLKWGAGVIGLIAVVHVGYYFPRVVDDLFISLRFAESFASGRGIVFNPGERVEGYSSPLWMVLQAFGFVFGFEGVTWTKLLGIASFGAVLVGTHVLARERLGVSVRNALLAPLFLALNSHVVAWSVLGLETPAYLALLVWYPIVLGRYLEGRRRYAYVAGGMAIALACARPEAPLYIAAMGLAELVPGSRDALRARFLAGVRVAVPVVAVLAVLLLARRAYFGLWLPHTYYVKGASSGFELAKLAPLVGEGSATFERMFYVAGAALASVLAVARRAPTVLVAIGCALFFTASVESDWMPSLRHLLPVSVFAAVAWAWAVDGLLRTPLMGEFSRGGAFTLAVIVVLAGAQIARTDSRLSRIDRHDRPWAVPKSADKASDAWLSMKRVEPPHIVARGPFEMGLVTQNYRVLEACAAPLEDSWYVGRDIGKVGFYTDVRVFDTAGLFTPDLVRNDAWRRKHKVGPELVRAAFARRPVAAELLDEWTAATGALPNVIAPYSLAQGTASEPIDLVKSDCDRPSPAETLRRYERSLAKLPRWFYLQTLYGESVGAAMQKRVRIVRELVRIHEQTASATPVVPALGVAAGAGALLGGNVESLGCEISPKEVAPGGKVTVTCWWRAIARSTSLFNAFIHFQDEHGTVLFNGDHPAGGLSRTTDWKPGEVVRDDVEVLVPAGATTGPYAIFFGMWNGDGRAAVGPPAMNDGKDRISAGVLTVAR